MNHEDSILSMDISPNGKMIATGDERGVIQLHLAPEVADPLPKDVTRFVETYTGLTLDDELGVRILTEPEFVEKVRSTTK